MIYFPLSMTYPRSMNSIWTILGLDGPVTDLKIIKKGYTAKLRVTRPEDDPMKFMALRDAFDKAKDYAHDNQDVEMGEGSAVTNPVDEDSLSLDQILEDATSGQDEAPSNVAIKRERIEERSEAVDKLMRKISKLIRKRDGRKDYQNWHKVLSKSAELSIDDYERFDRKMRETLLDLHDYDERYRRRSRKSRKRKKRYYKLPRATLLAIFKEMNWKVSHASDPEIVEQLRWLCEEGGIVKEVDDHSREKLEDDDEEDKGTGWKSDLKRFFLLIVAMLLLTYTISWLDPHYLDNSPEAKEAAKSPLLTLIYFIYAILAIYCLFFMITRILKLVFFTIATILRALVSALQQLARKF